MPINSRTKYKPTQYQYCTLGSHLPRGEHLSTGAQHKGQATTDTISLYAAVARGQPRAMERSQNAKNGAPTKNEEASNHTLYMYNNMTQQQHAHVQHVHVVVRESPHCPISLKTSGRMGDAYRHNKIVAATIPPSSSHLAIASGEQVFGNAMAAAVCG